MKNHAYNVERIKAVYDDIFPAPIFIASKIEAFKSRDKNRDGALDGRVSKDFYDIWLMIEFTALLNNPYVEEWIDAHVDYNASPLSTSLILQDLTTFTQSIS